MAFNEDKQFHYVITDFDDEHKTVYVEYEDGGRAQIRLVNPLPKNLEELQKIISQYTTPVEAMEARKSPSTDVFYIKGLVGVEQTGDRFSFNNMQPNPSPEDNPNEVKI